MLAICTILLLGVVFAYLCDLSAIKRNIVIDPNTSLGFGHLHVFVTSTNLFCVLFVIIVFTYFCFQEQNSRRILSCNYLLCFSLHSQPSTRKCEKNNNNSNRRTKRAAHTKAHTLSSPLALRFVSMCWLPLSLLRRRRWLANF